jgi:hypothetical protein
MYSILKYVLIVDFDIVDFICEMVLNHLFVDTSVDVLLIIPFIN